MESEVRPVRRAALDAAPLVLGYLPFALVLGATIEASSVPNLAGWAMSPLIFAGAAQLATVDLLDAGATLVIVVLTALVINLRHVMYSGAIAPWFQEQPRLFRWLGPFVMADPVYSLAAVRFPTMADARTRRHYYTALGGLLLTAWAAMTAIGIGVGNVLPEGLDLTVAVPLVFLALLIPMIEDRPRAIAAIVGGLVTIVANTLPLHLGLLVGALTGVVAGLLADPELRS